MKSTANLRVWAAALGIIGASMAGCDNSHQKISDLVSNPGRYENSTVRITGEVTQVYELPLGIANISAYRINDNTGQIWVVSHAGAPLRGDRLGVTGRLEPIGNLNLPVLGNIIGDVVEEQQRRLR
ncbi:MAG: hypothetical protein LC772_08080 [Chloroflexi bacterium]|nr:hypothetical protein [Chloroflexota bacterium]